MTDQQNPQEFNAPVPNPDLKSLDRLVGTWKVTGGAEGHTSYEWMEGGFFLIQWVDLGDSRGIEIIGHEHKYGQEPSPDIKSRYYGEFGNTFNYVYEIQGDTLMIWFGEKGSPAFYQGTFSADGLGIPGFAISVFVPSWLCSHNDCSEFSSLFIERGEHYAVHRVC